MKTALIAVALLAIGLYCTAVALLAWQQRRFIFIPDRNRPALQATGELHARSVTVHTADGLDLLAWLASPADDAQPVVLYLHGNAGNIGD